MWNKLDGGLASIYAKYLHARERQAIPPENIKLHLSLKYRDDLASAEAAGFEKTWDNGPVGRLAQRLSKTSSGSPPCPKS